jgi:hypothetical protein
MPSWHFSTSAKCRAKLRTEAQNIDLRREWHVNFCKLFEGNDKAML